LESKWSPNPSSTRVRSCSAVDASPVRLNRKTPRLAESLWSGVSCHSCPVMFFIQAISYAKYAKGQICFVFYEITVASRHTFQYAKYAKVPKGTPQSPQCFANNQRGTAPKWCAHAPGHRSQEGGHSANARSGHLSDMATVRPNGPTRAHREVT
jgi:glutaredoxin